MAHQLECNLALQALLLRQPDDAHTAAAQLLQQDEVTELDAGVLRADLVALLDRRQAPIRRLVVLPQQGVYHATEFVIIAAALVDVALPLVGGKIGGAEKQLLGAEDAIGFHGGASTMLPARSTKYWPKGATSFLWL